MTAWGIYRGTIMSSNELKHRLMAKILKTDSCWIWTASIDGKGYGQIAYNGKPHRAHRISYEIFKGVIPAGLDLDHLCRNRLCVNPEHLEPATRSENLLRGILHNSLKTACPRGHKYDYTDNKGRRRCRTCTRAIALKNFHLRKAKKC